MVCSVAVFGVGIGLGTSVLIYHLLRHWLRPPPSLPPGIDAHVTVSSRKPDVSADLCEDVGSSVDQVSPVREQEVCKWQLEHGLIEDISKVCGELDKAEGLRHRRPVLLDGGDCFTDVKPVHGNNLVHSVSENHRFEASANDDVINITPHMKLNNNTAPAVLLEPSSIGKDNQALAGDIENWSFSMNAEISRSDMAGSCEAAFYSHDGQYPSNVVSKQGRGECTARAELHKYLLPYRNSPDQNFSFSSVSFSPSVMSYQHSTPDDQQVVSVNTMSGMEPTNLESIFTSELESIEKSGARNTYSLHDFSMSELRRSRSCVSLDESMFLSNEFALIESPCSNDICSAVTSLEQLEREVAGVLSDCGDMERCVGFLRRHDRHDRVKKRYSLGVADSVIAADMRLFEMGRHDLSSLSEAQNSSVGIVNGRDSGYIWDDELLEPWSVPVVMNGSTASMMKRTTRSLSPSGIPRHHGSARGSIGVCVDLPVPGTAFLVQNNPVE